jgi:hypothetical protein
MTTVAGMPPSSDPRAAIPQPAGNATQDLSRQAPASVRRALVARFAKVEWTKVAAFLTAIGAIWTIYISAETVRSAKDQNSISARGQLSDRLNKAIGYLDSTKNDIDVRVGGIYSLEQVARDRDADSTLRTVVFDVLNTYVVDHPPQDCSKLSFPYADVNAAITVIGRRVSPDDSKINLSSACLSGAQLREASLENAWLQSTTLKQAALSGADLGSADLSNAILTNAIMSKSNTGKETSLKNAVLARAHLNNAILTDADLTGANLAGADLTGADFTGANLMGANLKFVCYDDPPHWPDGFNPPAIPNPRCQKS